MSATWAMSRALSQLMERHGVALKAPTTIELSEPTATPMLLSGFAATLDIDYERVAFAPFAFDQIPDNVPLRFDHTEQRAGYIELLVHNARGELVIEAFVDHPTARRCSAFSVSGDVLEYSLHDTDTQGFYACVKKMRLREISLVPAPINRNAKVLQRAKPSPASLLRAEKLKWHDLMIKRVQLVGGIVRHVQQINERGCSLG